MGWTSDEEGETSAHASESDSLEDLRPLKKARYVWQIKGKYHLKKSEEERSVIRGGPVRCTCSEFPSTSKDAHVIDQPPDRKPTVSVNPFFGIYPVEMPQPHTQNVWQLHRWQARQVARCFVDNTINRVLEDMGLVPLPPGNVPPPPLLEDGTEQSSVDSRGGGHTELEDEAVLMAIHSHGLQRPSTLTQQQRHRQTVPVCSAPTEPVVAEHSDFLDAAVAVAIEKKGLGTLAAATAAATASAETG
ncbi:uncharacterized protein LOC126198986 [Schistocerca nitens]|uniref:uncharacterized protein LOC126198986 n=1 Tax=Schistocerca nitens TaxID=7011 RepID=UPI0021176C11|nr:uncharacterized protein LOC126198986 [Schistocerca nitens]